MMEFEIEKILDRTGRLILAELQANARATFSELGRRVGLTSPAAAERVRRLEECGVIAGYHAQVNPARLGLPLQAFIRLRTPPERYPRFLAAARAMPEILECHHLTGEDAFILKVLVGAPIDLENLIGRLSPYGETATAVVLSSPIDRGWEVIRPPAG